MHVVLTQQFLIWAMAEGLEALDEVEFEGDPDLMIASRDFERIADARTNVSVLNLARSLTVTDRLCACALSLISWRFLFCFRLDI